MTDIFGLPTIDYSRDTERLRGLCGRKYQKAINRLIKRRGARCNQAGVFADIEDVELARLGRCAATASLSVTPAGHWFATLDWRTATEGGGAAPSVAQPTAYPSRDIALTAMRMRAYEKFQRIAERTHDSCLTDAMREEAARMAVALEEAFTARRQPDLFG